MRASILELNENTLLGEYMDSLRIVGLLVEFECLFDIQVPDEKFEHAKSFSDAVRVIDEYV
jgi:acyl carrier protein